LAISLQASYAVAYVAAGFSSKHSPARLKRYRDSYPSNESHDSRRFIAKAAVGQPWLSQRSNVPDKTTKLYHIFGFSTIPNIFKFFHAATLSIGTEYGTIRSNSNGEPAMGTMTSSIRRPRLDKDVVPFTEYRRTLNDCFERTARTHRPIVITQNGRSTSVMMSVADFERTWDEIEAWREKAEITKAVEISRQQFAEGKFRSEEEVFNRLNNMLLSMKEKGEIE
jgi:prevent-host-death family protein